MIKILLILLLTIILSSCVSDEFSLNRFKISEERVYGLRINGWQTTEVLNGNSISILDTGIVALAYAKETQFLIDFGVVFEKNSKFDILLRTTPQDFIDKRKNFKIEFDAEQDKIIFSEDGNLIKTTYYRFNSELKRFRIYNYEKKIKVFLDNDDILDYKTELASTEYIIFRNNKMDSLEINAVSVYKDSSLN